MQGYFRSRLVSVCTKAVRLLLDGFVQLNHSTGSVLLTPSGGLEQDLRRVGGVQENEGAESRRRRRRRSREEICRVGAPILARAASSIKYLGRTLQGELFETVVFLPNSDGSRSLTDQQNTSGEFGSNM